MEGIIGLCALLITIGGISDATFKQAPKRFLTARLFAFHQPNDSLIISRVFDRLLGNRLVSGKAFRRSMAISLLSISAAFAAAYAQDPVYFAPIAESVLTPNTASAVFCLLVCLVSTAIADFLSITQTRLFARTIEKFADWRITATMVLADITMSLTLFIINLFGSKDDCVYDPHRRCDPRGYSYEVCIFTLCTPGYGQERRSRPTDSGSYP